MAREKREKVVENHQNGNSPRAYLLAASPLKREADVTAGGSALLPATAGSQVQMSVLATGETVGRKELIHWELDLPEDLAGIVLAARTASAFLLRHTIIIGRHQKLGLPLQADNGELSQGDVDTLALSAEAQVAAKAGTDTGWNLSELAVTRAALAHVYQLHIEYDRIYRLYHCSGQVALAHILLV